jgi:hypothetical protein
MSKQGNDMMIDEPRQGCFGKHQPQDLHNPSWCNVKGYKKKDVQALPQQSKVPLWLCATIQSMVTNVNAKVFGYHFGTTEPPMLWQTRYAQGGSSDIMDGLGSYSTTRLGWLDLPVS